MQWPVGLKPVCVGGKGRAGARRHRPTRARLACLDWANNGLHVWALPTCCDACAAWPPPPPRPHQPRAAAALPQQARLSHPQPVPYNQPHKPCMLRHPPPPRTAPPAGAPGAAARRAAAVPGRGHPRGRARRHCLQGAHAAAGRAAAWCVGSSEGRAQAGGGVDAKRAYLSAGPCRCPWHACHCLRVAWGEQAEMLVVWGLRAMLLRPHTPHPPTQALLSAPRPRSCPPGHRPAAPSRAPSPPPPPTPPPPL